MITIDNKKCIHCGACLRSMGGYCLSQNGESIEIDDSICNSCQKCIALCPAQAFTQDGIPPERAGTAKITPRSFLP